MSDKNIHRLTPHPVYTTASSPQAKTTASPERDAKEKQDLRAGANAQLKQANLPTRHVKAEIHMPPAVVEDAKAGPKAALQKLALTNATSLLAHWEKSGQGEKIAQLHAFLSLGVADINAFRPVNLAKANYSPAQEAQYKIQLDFVQMVSMLSVAASKKLHGAQAMPSNVQTGRVLMENVQQFLRLAVLGEGSFRAEDMDQVRAFKSVFNFLCEGSSEPAYKRPSRTPSPQSSPTISRVGSPSTSLKNSRKRPDRPPSDATVEVTYKWAAPLKEFLDTVLALEKYKAPPVLAPVPILSPARVMTPVAAPVTAPVPAAKGDAWDDWEGDYDDDDTVAEDDSDSSAEAKTPADASGWDDWDKDNESSEDLSTGSSSEGAAPVKSDTWDNWDIDNDDSTAEEAQPDSPRSQ
jgi:hypothetical protein